VIALEAGADDISTEDDVYEVSVDPSHFEKVKKALESAKIAIASAAVTMIPKTTIKVDEKNAPKIISLMDALEDHDDIQNVYANFDIDDKLLAELQQSAG